MLSCHDSRYYESILTKRQKLHDPMNKQSSKTTIRVYLFLLSAYAGCIISSYLH